MTFMTRSGWQRWISLAVAYALAIQTILVAVAQAAQAAPASPFEISSFEILCDSSGASHPDHDGSPRESHATCCSLACAMFGAALAPRGDATATPVLAGEPAAVPAATHEDSTGRRGWSPGNPRAPPFAV